LTVVERTFIAIKPDAVQRGLIGTIIQRFEAKGYKLVGMKFMNVSRELAEQHYSSLSDKPFFPGLVDFITSSPVVAMAWEGDGVVTGARKIIGATSPAAADLGTIRGDFGVTVGRNLIHGSDAIETAERELGLWFKEGELTDWSPVATAWLYE
jgi:nucleoside-diphosphate kinase